MPIIPTAPPDHTDHPQKPTLQQAVHLPLDLHQRPHTRHQRSPLPRHLHSFLPQHNREAIQLAQAQPLPRRTAELDVLPHVEDLALELARDDLARDRARRAEREAREDDVEAARADGCGDGHGDAVAGAEHVRGRGPAEAGVGELGAREEEGGGGDAVGVHGPEFLEFEGVGGVEEGGQVHAEEGGDADGFVGGFGGGAVGERGPDQDDELGGGEVGLRGLPAEVVVVAVPGEFVVEVGGEVEVAVADLGEGRLRVDADGAFGELEVPGLGEDGFLQRPEAARPGAGGDADEDGFVGGVCRGLH